MRIWWVSMVFTLTFNSLASSEALKPLPIKEKISSSRSGACLSHLDLRKLRAAVSKIEELSNGSAQLRSKAQKLFEGHEYSEDLKTRWLLASVAVAFEHQEAILLLIKSKLFGSAFAMVRIVFDTTFHALWINKVATERQIDQAWRDELSWRRISVRADIERAYFSGEPEKRDALSALLKKQWPILCSYTHSGAIQLCRRFTKGNLRPNYREDEIIAAIYMTNAALLLLTAEVFMSMGHLREAEETLKAFSEHIPLGDDKETAR
jgi:hypothetical protein